MHNPKFLQQNCKVLKELSISLRVNTKKTVSKPCDTNLGLESLIARVDDGIRVIVHNVSATLAWTSGGLWFKQKGNSYQII